MRRTSIVASFLVSSALVACGDSSSGDPPPLVGGAVFGDVHAGQFHLGPVDFEESAWSNACAPYPSAIVSISGDMLAGVSNAIATPGSLCDACIEVTTDMGKSAVLRVITYGDTNAPGDIDLSPAAYAALDSGEYPRAMTWRLVECDNGSPLYVQFQTGANVWWTSLFVRNASVAIDRVEVMSTNHPTWFTLTRGTDGAFTDGGGFGEGAFTLRVVGLNGAILEIPIDGFSPGELVAAPGNLPPG